MNDERIEKNKNSVSDVRIYTTIKKRQN
jgi:hypothetical protein